MFFSLITYSIHGFTQISIHELISFSHFHPCSAFVKSERVDNFPGLTVKYVRGSDPYITLMNEQRDVVETLSIDKWNTDSVEEFLKEHLL